MIMTAAQTFGLKVVAEGVETQMQAERLIELGADYLQGYLFCKPLSEEAVRQWLAVRYAAVAQDCFGKNHWSNSTRS
jgi:EAL domain-containing protein (putative c-di-GMP-specific phosphodiesterase class I)